MNTGNASSAPSPGDFLRRRESATVAMIRDIDAKMARLGSAKTDRIAALKRIRAALVRAKKPAPVGPESHER